MSIPKEPRQLLVNLMYLVLTALLALNVSAEILQAFFSMDDSLKGSSSLVAQSNAQVVAAIEEQASAYAQFAPLRDKALKTQSLVTDFNKYIDAVRTKLEEEAGGLDESGQPKRKRDKDVTTRLFIKNGMGREVYQQIVATRKLLLDLIDKDSVRTILEARMPLSVTQKDPVLPEEEWVVSKFQQMPVAALLPVLSKYQNDARISESVVLNYLLEQASNVFYKPDSFTPVVAAEKSYIIRNEPFSAELFLASYSSTADNIRVSVDGRSIPVNGGKALFTTGTSGLGTRRHEMLIELSDPVSGETKQFRKTFSYEVGERAVTVSADKMNVLYVGVENPISIAAAGVPTAQLSVNASGVQLRALGGGKYIAIPQKTGDATITVSGGGLQAQQFNYRIKRIPDPVVKLGKYQNATLPANSFKAQLGLIPDLGQFDFDAKCKIMEYEVARVPKGDDVRAAMNSGATLNGNAKAIMNQATTGDTYYFDKIAVRCPGDTHNRQMNGLIYKIR